MPENPFRFKIRPSKIINTFGPGAIMDLPGKESVIVMGLDYWKDEIVDDNNNHIDEPRLRKKLGTKFFVTPSDKFIIENGRKYYAGVPVRDFPFKRICPQCRRIWDVSELVDEKGEGHGLHCPTCKTESGEHVKTFPPRLVAACPKGHLQDFPWKLWSGCTCDEKDSELYYLPPKDVPKRFGGVVKDWDPVRARNSDLVVICGKCGRWNTMESALKTLKINKKEIKCRGERPWLGKKEEGCGETLKGLMRGASNVYFPLIESSLLIPPFSNKVYRITERDVERIADNYRDLGEEGIRRYINNTLSLKKELDRNGIEEDEAVKAFISQIEGDDSWGNDIKKDEWRSFIGKPEDTDNFKTEHLDLDGHELSEWFQSAVRVTKLREYSVLKGFRRIYDQAEVAPIHLSKEEHWELLRDRRFERHLSKRHAEWLPGIELNGEGIFFQLRKDRLEEWEHDESVVERSKSISEADNQPNFPQGVDPSLPRTLLIHTFSHHIIRAISLSCGYSMASLKERLYSTKDTYGVLIYTATSDSEGTLGGLVDQARNVETLYLLIEDMLNKSKICSHDPLCSIHNPSMTKNPWGASCHACTHVPETSCEMMGNKFLDRLMLMGKEGKVKGYFN